jgi:hypothetical protein
MPNGRSGGFPLEKADLVRWIAGIPPTVEIGRVTPGERPRSAAVAEVAALLESCPHDRIAAEEQDHAFYIIHLSNQPVVWVIVDSESPLFQNIRQRHLHWKTEHPDWDGWIAF